MARFRFTASSTLVATLAALPYSARADFYLHHWENQHETHRNSRLSIHASYYETRENFDATGANFVPAGLEKYSRMQTDIFGVYGLTKNLSTYARIGWARTQLDSSISPFAGNTFGFTDSTLGVNFRAFTVAKENKLGGLSGDLQLQGDFPLYSNQNISGPALGDGTVDMTAGAFLSLPIVTSSRTTLTLTGGAGFTYRTDNRSPAIPWSFSSEFVPRDDGIFASASVFGVESLRSDGRTSSVTTATPAITVAPATGGSFLAGAINPSLITLRGEAGYQFGPDVAATVFYSQSLAGQAAPHGFSIGVGLRTRIGNSQQAANSAHLSPKDYGHTNQGFINYSLEARVTRVNDRLNIVKIDKGTQDGVTVGQTFDIFFVKKDGNSGEAIARGRVSAAQLTESALTIEEYFKEIWIDEGFMAKRPVE